MTLFITDIIGHLHPVLVHLPIGILLLACLFQWLMLNSRFTVLRPAIPVTLFWGMLAAIASCITGYLLAGDGEYDEVILGRHQWLGISVAVASLILYLLHQLSVGDRTARWFSLLLVILITITGHLGGTLTHGSGYLTAAGSSAANGAAIPAIPDIQEAVVYTDAVKPLLQARCYSCHGPDKKKGKLRLDAPEFMLKGGEGGKLFTAGKADESEMIRRLLLPLTDEDHMPPKEKPQLTKNEIGLLHWWINNGADFTKKVKAIPQPDNVKPILLALQAGDQKEEAAATGLPDKPVEKADEKTLALLKEAGVIMVPVAQNTNYLSASFVTVMGNVDSVLKLLAPLSKQLIALNVANSNITDGGMATVGKLNNLVKLHLNNTAITDQGLQYIQQLKKLQFLNLVHTPVSLKGLLALKGLSSLQQLYLYQTGVTKNDWPQLQQLFPKVKLDSGGYVVPILVSDTTTVKE